MGTSLLTALQQRRYIRLGIGGCPAKEIEHGHPEGQNVGIGLSWGFRPHYHRLPPVHLSLDVGVGCDRSRIRHAPARRRECLPLTGPNYPLGLIKRKEKSVGPHVSRFEPNQAMILDGWGSFLLRPLEGGKTRLIVRDPTQPMPFPTMVFWSLLFEPGHFTMEREMMKGIKARAERTSAPGSVWHSPATTRLHLF